ncbi:MAG: enoyl-CoA hydratase family protein [Proteobacteria bacterium]|nr:enoyl-CoA hydratase family protein [Pseudomonadota bacterium]
MSIPLPKTFAFELSRGVATITLDRPERLNSLTFRSYRELADTFAALGEVAEARAVVITGRGKGFCSGGDQHDIIADLIERDMQGLLEFTRLTGRLIQSIRQVRRPVIAAVNGVAVGAGAVIATACDMRIASRRARFGFIFPRVGLCGADMGAAYLLPRVVGLGHAAELLFMGEIIDAETAYRIGLVNRLTDDGPACQAMAREWAQRLARGPAFAHAMTKQMLESEAGMTLADAIEAEAEAQAICMVHPDFKNAHRAFKEKREPVFAGTEDFSEES